MSRKEGDHVVCNPKLHACLVGFFGVLVSGELVCVFCLRLLLSAQHSTAQHSTWSVEKLQGVVRTKSELRMRALPPTDAWHRSHQLVAS